MSVTQHLRSAVKVAIQGLSLLIVFPFALVAGFGRFSAGFQGCGQLLALVPGLPGDYFRIAYYAMTLKKCSLHSRISFGTLFAQSRTYVGKGVYIGIYCVIGACEIGERSQIASHVQVLSGSHQHRRDSDGHILTAREEEFEPVSIGADCWIGASAIIMADVGPGATVGAGAVVTRTIPSGVTAVGIPARAL